MKRSIIRLGTTTHVVSLPSTWLIKNSLEKGDELDLTYQEKSILLTPRDISELTQSVTIDITGFTERVLRWKISSLHKQGYDEIIIASYTKEQFHVISDLVHNLFIGFIIKEKSQIRLIIGQIASSNASEFDATLRHAFRMMLSSYESLENAFYNQDYTSLSSLKHHEHENNKLTNFCERLLNKSLKEKEKGHFWYVIAWNLEKIVDNFKYISIEYALSIPKIDKETREVMALLGKFIKGYYDCFYNFSFNSLNDLGKERLELKSKMRLLLKQSNVDLVIFHHYLHITMLQTVDFSASMIALRAKFE